jgi:threonine/homoserine/homoserine lactone efflux protein
VEEIYLLKGIILGFLVAAPVGPIGILCIKRTLSYGWLFGFVSGLGAATADTMYASIAAFSLTVIINLLLSQQFFLRLIGGIFLCYLGIKIFFSKPSEKEASTKGGSLFSAYISVFFLTVMNPVTILVLAGIFSGLGMVRDGINYTSGTQVVLGILIGSASWWLILSIVVSMLRNRMNIKFLSWVNHVSGIAMLIFGLIALYGLK